MSIKKDCLAMHARMRANAMEDAASIEAAPDKDLSDVHRYLTLAYAALANLKGTKRRIG